ncbi:MAG TPA: DUF3037 domain-containing protein [Myxococcaceae bacterium]|nr:DUF3037 domain-containing protein [Myxococcaceae bacterium]
MNGSGSEKPSLAPYDYAVLRVVPRVERGEFINAGVILHAPVRDFLEARVFLDAPRLQALCPSVDPDWVQRHLDAVVTVARGGAAAGPMGSYSRNERFHWLTAPRSTIIQPSAVHGGVCSDPAATLDALMRRLVLPLDE